MVRVKATYAFAGNPQESQLSFPAGAILEASPRNGGNHAPRNGWMHGRYEHQTGWFPESYVMVVDDDPPSALHGPPTGAPPPPPPAGQNQQAAAAAAAAGEIPTVMAYSYQQENDITVTPLSPSAPPAVTAMPVPITSTTTTNEDLSFTTVPKKALREDQLSQLIQQGYTRGKCWSCMPYFLFLIQFSFSSRLLRSF